MEYFDDKALFAPSEGINDLSLHLSWQEFSERIYNNFDFRRNELDQGSTHYLLMIDDIDMFQLMGSCYLSSLSPKESYQRNPFSPLKLIISIMKSFQSLDTLIPNVGDVSNQASAITGNGIATLIVYGKKPSEIPMQLPSMNFNISVLNYDLPNSNEVTINNPYEKERQQPLLSEYLKYR